MSKGASQQPETPQQRAMVDFAVNQLRDYKQRWLPVQAQLAAQIQDMGKEGSAARELATGKSNVDTQMQFARAEGALDKANASRGLNVNSSRSKLSTTGMGEDLAKTQGLGEMVSDQQVNEAYTRGLQALTAIGRGERADVGSGLINAAKDSARTAASSAEASAAERAGGYQLAGQFAGFGLQRALGSPPAQSPMTIDYSGYGIENSGGVPTRGGV